VTRLYLEVTGCRLNACEAEEISRRAAARGATMVDSPGEADVSLLMTCAVTSRSQARCRRAARALLRGTTGRVVVGGCSARLFPGDFATGSDRIRTARTAGDAVAGILGDGCSSDESGFFEARSSRGSRSRALLKIQDGCSNGCSYCIVPAARGPSRSLEAARIVEMAGDLEAEGFREIVLTGVDLASWGADLPGGGDLPDLVARIARSVGSRIRLGSLEPMRLTRDFVRRLAVPGMCRHFHVPFQSGSRAVRESMGRPGDPAEVLGWIAEFFPGAATGTDVIAGYPGETEEDFRMTLALATDPRISYLHVFPFCPRPGTRASAMHARADMCETARRAAMLRSASESSRRRFRTASLGTSARALVEGRSHDGGLVALTDNYIPLRAPEGASEGDEISIPVTRENVLWNLR
jgi:threonylcarbamoyladenosine tRNA methylthiotransferase MtaB